MSDVTRALVGRGSVYGAVTVFQSASMFLVLPLLTRALGSEEYGLVATCTVVYQVVLAVAPLGLPSVVAWDMYERQPDAEAKSRRLAASAWLAATAVVVLVHISGPLWSRMFDSVPYRGPLALAVLTAIPGTALVISQAMLQAQGRPIAFGVATLTFITVGQGGGLLLASAGSGTASEYLQGVLLGATVGGLLGFLLTGTRPWRLIGATRIRSALAHGGPTVVHGAAFLVLAAGDRVIVERLLGLRDAGRYHVAYLVGALGLTALQALNNAWAPLVHSADEEGRWELLASTTATMYRLATWIGGGIAIGAPLALVLLLPASYDPRGLAEESAIIAATAVPFVTYLSAVHVVFQLRRTWVLAWTTPVAGVVNVGLNLVLIPHLRLAGAALATLLSYLLWAGLVRLAASRIQVVRWPRTREAAAYALAGAVVIVGIVIPARSTWLGVRAGISILLAGLLASAVADAARRRPGPAVTGGAA